MAEGVPPKNKSTELTIVGLAQALTTKLSILFIKKVEGAGMPGERQRHSQE
jgi:hypothetical protein